MTIDARFSDDTLLANFWYFCENQLGQTGLLIKSGVRDLESWDALEQAVSHLHQTIGPLVKTLYG